jgi:transposase
MATPRQFRQELDQNVRRTQNISPAMRDQAIGMLKGGMTVPEVARVIHCSEPGVRHLCLKYHQTGTIQDKSRSGWPPVLSKQQKKNHLQKSLLYSKDRVLSAAARSYLCERRGHPIKATQPLHIVQGAPETWPH